MIKPAVSPVHADVLSKLPILLVTAHDGSGRLWASALVGSPGFLSVAAADPSLLNISSARLLGDGERAACAALLPLLVLAGIWLPVRSSTRLPGRPYLLPLPMSWSPPSTVSAAFQRTPSHTAPTSAVALQPPPLLPSGMLALHPGQLIGCLGIQVSTRRRVRVNGAIEAAERDAAGRLTLRVRVRQAYANCPKYIQVRRYQRFLLDLRSASQW